MTMLILAHNFCFLFISILLLKGCHISAGPRSLPNSASMSSVWDTLESPYYIDKGLIECHTQQRAISKELFTTSNLSLAHYLEPLHYTLTCVKSFWFPTYYTKLSVNCLFEVLNEFKSKSCQLKNFITFRDLHFTFINFSIQGHLKNSNFQIQTQFCMIRWIQMKRLPTTKFNNFSRSTKFILVVFPSENILKNQIFKFSNSNAVLHDKMDSNEKVSYYKIL